MPRQRRMIVSALAIPPPAFVVVAFRHEDGELRPVASGSAVESKIEAIRLAKGLAAVYAGVIVLWHDPSATRQPPVEVYRSGMVPAAAAEPVVA